MEARQVTIERKKKKRLLYKLSIIITLFALLISASILFIYASPYNQQAKINPSNDTQIFYMGQKLNDIAYKTDDQLYIPYTFIKEYIDSEIALDENSRYVIITTDKDVFHISIDNNESLLNLEPYSFTYPIIEKDNNIFLPVDPINNYYDINLDYIADKNILLIHDLKEPLLQGRVLEDAKLRKEPKLNSNWYESISQNKDVNIIREENGWYWIESVDGLMGYIKKDYVEIADIQINSLETEKYQAWNPLGENIVMTWEYANKYSSIKTDKVSSLTSVQVVSPTWFKLINDGMVESIADINYVNWAHENNYLVWGLFSNSFDLDITHEMLSDADLRIKVIKQILTYVDLYKLDGINIDFENVYLEDKELLVQFVRELTPLLHEMDRTISIDVTFKSLSEHWSMFLDREKLGEIVDYMAVMAYDEHWASSPVAGSVASLPWVEKGIKRILEEVPSDKILLGVPLYTRIWTEEVDEDGNIDVSSETLRMRTTNNWIAENSGEIKYDEDSGQNYVEIKSGEQTYKVWIEDNTSIEKRVEIMKKYNLAGIATWRRGFESKNFWDELSGYLEKR